MYTSKIINQSNELNCEQIDELIKIRQKLGIKTGGIPPCNLSSSTNKQEPKEKDDVMEEIIRRVTGQILSNK